MHFIRARMLVFLAFAGVFATNASGEAANPINSQAYKTHRVAQAVPAFSQVCLLDNLTVARAAGAAKQAGVGLTAPTRLRLPGKPLVELTARKKGRAINGRDDVFDWFNCRVEIRGTWAGMLLPDVRAGLKANGFRVGAFSTVNTSNPIAYNDAKITVYRGSVTRGGGTYTVTVAEAPSGGNATSRAFSGTVLMIETQ